MKSSFIKNILLLIVMSFISSNSFAQHMKDEYFKLTVCEGNSIINSKTTQTDLIKKFGKDKVTIQKQYYAEGTEEYECTILFPGTPDSLIIKWKEGNQFIAPEFIEFNGANSNWILSNGIKIGTTLKELVKLNGKDFTFSGFGWDYGGYPNFDEGELMSDCYYMRLGFDWNENYSDDLIQKISGDIEVSTKNEALKKVNVYVDKVTLRLN
ncbi:MAG: hypothetical protein V1720_17220 [bacterium]